MSFLDEKKKPGKRPDYADIDKDGNREEPMEKAFKDKTNAQNEEKGYGKDPETGKITPMSSDDAISNWLKKIKSDIDNEEGNIKEDKKTIELPANTTFTLDLKHLMKKHIDEGKSVKDTLTLTKTLMKKLHNKGKVEVDGTKVIFKENSSWGGRKPKDPRTDTPWGGRKPKDPRTDIPWGGRKPKDPRTDIPWGGKDPVHPDDEDKTNEQEDTQLALPEPPARDYLGDDGKDYEGGMAKSQMLKMKKYAAALCDMIDDESQLESWVQAKLTKASEYMSAVYHYLDYQNSKINEEEEEFKPLTKQEKDSLVKNGKLKKSELAAYEKFLKDNPDLPDSMPKAIKAFKSKMNENIDPKNIDWEDIDPHDENRFDYKSGTIYGYTIDGRKVEAPGSYTEFGGYEVEGDIELSDE